MALSLNRSLIDELSSVGWGKSPAVCSQSPSLPDSFVEILKSLQMMQAADPPRDQVYYTLARLYTGIGDCDRAIENLRLASNRFPNDFSVYAELGDLYFSKGDFESALVAYHSAQYGSRRHFDDFLTIIERQFSQDASRQATIRALERLESNDQDPVLLAVLAKGYRESRMTDQALNMYRRFLDRLAVGNTRDDEWRVPASTRRVSASFLELNTVLAYDFLVSVNASSSFHNKIDALLDQLVRASKRYARILDWNKADPEMNGEILYGTRNHATGVFYNFPASSHDVCLSYEVYDVDYPDEVAIYVNLHRVAYADLTANESWSNPRNLSLPKEILNSRDANIILFIDTYNRNFQVLDDQQSYLYGVRQVKVQETSCDPKSNSGSRAFSGIRSVEISWQ